jgi:xanthine dehydrogenase accessory factor
MICGGKAVLLLDFIPPITENTGFFTQMGDSVSAGHDFHFVTAFTGSGDAIDVFGHCLVFSDGSVIGGDFLRKPDVAEIKEELHSVRSTTVLSTSNQKFIIDPVRRFKTLYSFGAGHVALPTAHIAAMVGFQVVVIDDREEFANAARFPDASNVVVKDFEEAMGSLDIDKDSFVIILTRGHKYDRVVLEQAIKTDAGYIGMIGSKSKREAIYQAIIASGAATAEQLEGVHSPIGLPIGGETPEEIAVSIVAELIQEREKQKT